MTAFTQNLLQVNNKRIAKNTILLYFRMIFIMAVNLYSSRIVLQVLGVEDYGIYNVVGSIITMLTFITASMSSAVSRFITFELGKGEIGNTECIFRCACTIFYIFAIIGFIFAETIGLWFVRDQLNILEGREIAVFWVYQFSVLSFIISLISVSYNALIIAKEKMNAFAYISIYDGIARLAILYVIAIMPFDQLILYAGLLTLVQLSVRVIYTIYCKRNFVEANGNWLWNKEISQQVFSYAGWTVTGHLAIVGYTQGINILLNIYFGSVVNAARAIATQVQTALAQFYANFQTAIRPQIIKNYARGNIKYMHSLVLNTGRYSFLLALIVSVPFLTFTEYVIKLWLVNPPEHVIAFVRLTIIAGISNSLSQHTLMAIHATGDIKKFQLWEGGCLLTILPFSWVALKFFHVTPEFVILIYVAIEILTQFVRVHIVYPKIRLEIKYFYTKILQPSLMAMMACIVPAVLFYYYVSPTTFVSFLASAGLLLIILCIITYLIGLKKEERAFINNKITTTIRIYLYKTQFFRKNQRNRSHAI